MIEAKQFYELLSECWHQGEGGIEDVRSYSGRAMYGKQCIAVTGDDVDPWKLALAVAYRASLEGIDVDNLPERTCQDSMGRGVVLYWPGLEWDADEMRELGDER